MSAAIHDEILFLMDIEKTIKERRTVHDYQGQKVPDEIVEKAVELALWAPNHKLTNPWKFVWMGPDAREKIAEISVHLKKVKDPGMSELVQGKLKQKFLEPSHLLAVLQKKSANPFQSKEDYASIACGIQNATLFLWEKGIGSKWTTGAVTTHEKTYRALNVNAEKEEIVGFLWIGYARQVPEAPKRPSLGESLVKTD